MEFANEEDLLEWTKIHGKVAENISDNGFGFCLDEKSNKFQKEIKKVECYVAAKVENSNLYLSKSGVTYLLTEAKVFPEGEAINKAKFMTKKGKYCWEPIKKS